MASKFMSPKNSTSSFVMSGHLGNQLFQLMAALLYASKTNSKTILEYKDYKYSKNEANSMLSNVQNSMPIVFPQERLGIFRYFALKSYALTQKFEIFRKFRSIVFGDYFESDIGFTSAFSFNKKYREVHGYFQTYLIPRQLEELELFPKFEISDPTNWYNNLVLEIQSKSVLVIHIRRGDYYQFRNEFGILVEEYYYRAAQIVYSRIQIDETWIFTNDTEEVKNSFNLRKFQNPKLLIPPSCSHPMESLLLMSLGRAIIISNSSFSWWSAFLSKEASLILAPRKWFKGIQDPKDLLPPEWITLESDWII